MEKSFEENYRQVEKIIEEMSQQNTDLKRTIDIYEEAMVLIQKCETLLTNSENRITEINKKYSLNSECKDFSSA